MVRVTISHPKHRQKQREDWLTELAEIDDSHKVSIAIRLAPGDRISMSYNGEYTGMLAVNSVDERTHGLLLSIAPSVALQIHRHLQSLERRGLIPPVALLRVEIPVELTIGDNDDASRFNRES